MHCCCFYEVRYVNIENLLIILFSEAFDLYGKLQPFGGQYGGCPLRSRNCGCEFGILGMNRVFKPWVLLVIVNNLDLRVMIYDVVKLGSLLIIYFDNHMFLFSQDRTMWRNHFGRGVGPVVRQITERTNEWMNECFCLPYGMLHAESRKRNLARLFCWKT